jgi:ankyrin repeat domain-containing protein 50
MKISSTIVEHMKEYCKKPDFALAYFYFDFNDTEKQEVSNFVSSLIAQLCSKVVDLPEQLKELHKRCNNGQEKAAMHELKAALSGMVKDFEDVFIIVDALDECPKNGEREELLGLITEMKSWSPSNLHLLATSRQEPDIKEALTSLTNSAITIQGSEVESDIKLHIVRELATDPKLKNWSSDIKFEIESTLVAGANGM